MTLKVTVGTDPECFVEHKDTGQIISAHDLIPGTKEQPFPVHYGAIQVDGLAAEFNTTPSDNPYNFSSYVQTVMEELTTHLKGHKLKIVSAVVFPEAYMRSLPDSVIVLGCNPDYNAWTGEMNPKPERQQPGLCVAAGHLHIGWTKDERIDDPTHIQDCFRVVKQLDYMIGMYSLMWDTDARRRTLYGKAGACRIKPYGVEYRTPSNMWLRHPSLYTWLWHACYYAIEGLSTGGVYFPDRFGNLAQTVIDNNDLLYIKEGRLKNEIQPFMKQDWPTWTKTRTKKVA